MVLPTTYFRDTYCILWVGPHESVLQFTTNIANGSLAKRMADSMSRSGHSIFAVLSVGELLDRIKDNADDR